MPVPITHRIRQWRQHPPHIENLMFAFWASQAVLWLGMMFYVQIFNHHLGDSVLYVTQISHWALIETAATAAYANWVIHEQRHGERHRNEPPPE